jgi:hypothetical protein
MYSGVQFTLKENSFVLGGVIVFLFVMEIQLRQSV